MQISGRIGCYLCSRPKNQLYLQFCSCSKFTKRYMVGIQRAEPGHNRAIEGDIATKVLQRLQYQGVGPYGVMQTQHVGRRQLNFHRNLAGYTAVAGDRNVSIATAYKFKYLAQAPAPALVLGFSGLIPFASAALYCAATNSCDADLLFAQMAYGATILSFLGGVRWGLTLNGASANPDWLNLTYSVTPSLVAWLGLLLDQGVGLTCLIAGLSGAAVIDIQLTGYPSWFKSLRFYLSSGAALSLFVSLVYYCKSPKREDKCRLRDLTKTIFG